MKTLQIIPIDSLKVIPKEFANIPLYKEVSPGVLEQSSGVKLKHTDILLFDVTNMDTDFKTRYADHILTYEASLVNPLFPQSEPTIRVIPAAVYSLLSSQERDSIGQDYVMIEQAKGGLRLKPIKLSDTNLAIENLYIKIDFDSLSDDLKEKLSSEIRLLSLGRKGLYSIEDDSLTKKSHL